MRRPTGVTAIAVVFFLIAAYLGGIGVVVLVSPGTVSMTGPPAARIRTRRPVRGSASRRGLGADWLGIIPAAWLGSVSGDARNHIGSGDAGSTFGTDSLSCSLVAGLGRPGDFCARGDGVVSIQDAYRWTVLESSKSPVGADALVRPVERSSTVLQAPSASFGAISSCGKFFSDGPCKQQIPRTLLPRERSCERLGMTRILGFCKSNRRSRTGGKPLRTNRCRATLDWAGEGTRPYVRIVWINIIASW